MMKQIFIAASCFIVLFVAVIVPGRVFGESGCSPYGYTIAFINGVFDTPQNAQANATALQLLVGNSYKAEPIHIELAYNPQHLGGVGDVIQTLSQILLAPISQYDFHEVLRQLSVKDTTQRLLLVGHSQGALYANSVYEYLTTQGIPAHSLGVYAVATPANYVAGKGLYINAVGDVVLYGARMFAQKFKLPLPLAGNVDLSSSVAISDLPQTHEFLSYLAKAQERMISDIHTMFDGIQNDPLYPAQAGHCLPAPPESVSDMAQRVLFAFVDPMADGVKMAAVNLYTSVASAVTNVFAIAQSGYSLLTSVVGALTNTLATAQSNPAAPQNQGKNFKVLKKLYGSSIDEEAYKELHPSESSGTVLAKNTPTHAVPKTITDSSAATLPPLSIATTQTVATLATTSVPTSTVSTSEKSASSSVYVYRGGTGLPPPPQLTTEVTPIVDVTVTTAPVATTTDSVIVSTTTVAVEASSTPVLSDETVSDATSTAPAVSTSSPFISDTFDVFNSAGWKTYTYEGANTKHFGFNDGSDGSCVKGGCVVGEGYRSTAPLDYLEIGEGLSEGAFSIYIKEAGSPGATVGNPLPIVGICETGKDCVDAARIDVSDFTPIDTQWHQYYFAWREGSEKIERCILQDDIDSAHCSWVATIFSPKTTFDGIMIRSGNGYASQLGSELWFDELKAE